MHQEGMTVNPSLFLFPPSEGWGVGFGVVFCVGVWAGLGFCHVYFSPFLIATPSPFFSPRDFFIRKFFRQTCGTYQGHRYRDFCSRYLPSPKPPVTIVAYAQDSSLLGSPYFTSDPSRLSPPPADCKPGFPVVIPKLPCQSTGARFFPHSSVVPSI